MKIRFLIRRDYIGWLVEKRMDIWEWCPLREFWYLPILIIKTLKYRRKLGV